MRNADANCRIGQRLRSLIEPSQLRETIHTSMLRPGALLAMLFAVLVDTRRSPQRTRLWWNVATSRAAAGWRSGIGNDTLQRRNRDEIGARAVIDAQGREQQVGASHGARRGEVRLALPPLAAGSYALSYKVLAADGHISTGVLRFRVVRESNGMSGLAEYLDTLLGGPALFALAPGGRRHRVLRLADQTARGCCASRSHVGCARHLICRLRRRRPRRDSGGGTWRQSPGSSRWNWGNRRFRLSSKPCNSRRALCGPRSLRCSAQLVCNETHRAPRRGFRPVSWR